MANLGRLKRRLMDKKLGIIADPIKMILDLRMYERNKKSLISQCYLWTITSWPNLIP